MANAKPAAPAAAPFRAPSDGGTYTRNPETGALTPDAPAPAKKEAK